MLVDLYVLGTDESDWERLLALLRGGDWLLEYSVGGEPAALPERVGAIFELRREASPLLRVDPGALRLQCHFFHSSDIEFDFDPRDVEGLAWLARLLAFMRAVAVALGNPVLMTPENSRDIPWFRVGPDPSEVVWLR